MPQTHVLMEPKSPGADREGSTSIELGLGIGAGGGGGGGGVIKEGKSAFTAAQLHELQQQNLVLNYLVEGLPVPHHLIVPIWKSVAKSFGSANGGVYNQFPSFIGFSHQGFDYKSMTDSEPGRCRRTDGKKWRCSKEVVPDQKYCERHMHRGRNRSKKFMEASVAVPEPNLALSSNSTRTNTESSESTKAKSNEPVPVTVKLELATPSSHTSSTTLITKAPASKNNVVSKKDSASAATTSIGGSCGSQNDVIVQKYATSNVVTTIGTGGTGGSDDNLAVKKESTATITTPSTGGSSGSHCCVAVKEETAATTPTAYTGGDILCNSKGGVVNKGSAATTTCIGDKNGSGSDTVMKDSASCSISAAAEINCNRRGNNDVNDIMLAEYDHSCTRIESKWSKNDANNWKFVSLVPPGFGLSPNSVLQVVGGGNPHPNPDSDVADSELTRCRRTDGKKWRCSKEVIPDEKYCGRHMHRGAKKLAMGVASLQSSVTVAAAPPPSCSGVFLDPPLAIPKKATNLNTELSISIATTSSQQRSDGEDSPSSSDATTITDENGSIAHLLVLSP